MWNDQVRIRRLTSCAAALVMAFFASSAPARGSQNPTMAPEVSRPKPADSPGAPTGAEAQAEAANVRIAQPASLASVASVVIDGPEAPVPPAVMTRDDLGRVTVRAVRIDQPITFDGRLNDEIYQQVAPIDIGYQQLPDEGASASEPTDAWIFFDDRNLYISVRCTTSEPDRLVATELRRDSNNVWSSDDNFTVALDTFYDRRNGVFFQTNPLGALRDQAIVDGQLIESWNTIWDVRSVRTAGGWSLEMVIPFKSLRYRRPGPQVWGINLRRVIRSKNELATLTAVPASYGGMGVSQMAVAGTLVGVETPRQSMNLEVKPYVASAVTTDRTAAVPIANDFAQNVGLDFKYGLTRSLIADVTVNTDFAQVEEDVQQVNLTRFSLFFPEKRDFFLEGQGIFAFGGRSTSAQGSSQDVPVLFFSRRIGLTNGQAVPVRAGARVTGRSGPFEVGLLNVQTADKASAGASATNFSALRLRRDVLRRSSVGVLATGRMPTSGDEASSFVLGADANLRFFDNLAINAYYARTDASGPGENGVSYRGQFNYTGDRYGLGLEHLMVDQGFDPAVGFLRREDFRRTSASARFSPRPANSRLIRKLTWESSFDYVTDAAVVRLENRSLKGSFGIEFHSGDLFRVQYAREYEWLPQAFAIARNVTVPSDSFITDTTSVSYNIARQRKVSGRVAVAAGSFYGGTKREASYSGRIGFVPQLSMEPSVSINWVDLPFGSFTAGLFSTRVLVTPTPHLIVSSLVQLNTSSRTVSSSVRFRWEYRLGSDLFVVYSDGRDTSRPGFPDLLNRSFVIKLTRLLRF